MYYSLEKNISFIKKKIYSWDIKKIKAILNRKRLKFSKTEIVYYLVAILEHQKHKVTFKKVYEKFKKELNYKLLYSTFMQNISLLGIIYKYLFEEEKREFFNKNKKISIKQKLGLNIEILDSSLLQAIKNESRTYEKHYKNTTARNGNLITGWKMFAKVDFYTKKISFIDITNIRKSDITYLKENQNKILKNINILLMDSGFNSKALQKELKEIKNLKIIAPIRLANKNRKGNSFEDFSKFDFDFYKERYLIERIFKKLKNELGDIKLSINFSLSSKINLALIYSSCLDYNLNIT